MCLSQLDPHKFVRKRHQGKYVRKLIQYLHGTVPTSDKKFIQRSQHFVLHDGSLYWRNCTPEGSHLVLVVPRHLTKGILKTFHDDLTAGHLGHSLLPGLARSACYTVRNPSILSIPCSCMFQTSPALSLHMQPVRLKSACRLHNATMSFMPT